MERKSTTSSIRCASSAALGISTITPGLSPRARTLLGELGRLRDGGDHRRHHPRLGAGPLGRGGDAVELAVHQSGVAEGQSAVRGHPSAGFSSPSCVANAIGLSDPASRVRTTTYAAVAVGREHRGVDLGLLLGGRLVLAVEEAQLGAEEARRPAPARLPADAAEGPSATLASSLTGMPVGRRGGAGPAGQRRAERAALLDPPRGVRPGRRPARWCRSRRRRRRTSRPGSSMTPAAPTTHGMPSWRAMIAVWLVAPPRSVTRAVTSSGSRPEVSLGARSSATSTDGSLGVGTPGGGSPTRWAITRRSMSRRSVTRSAIRPPMLVKIETNCSTAPCTAATGPCPVCRFFGDARAQALVARQPGARGEHLRGRALGGGRLAGEGVGDGCGRLVVGGRAASASAKSPSPKRAMAAGETSPRTWRTGPAATPGTTGVPLSVVADVGGCGHGHTVDHTGVDNQHIRD